MLAFKTSHRTMKVGLSTEGDTMNIEQIERRLRALELTSKGFDYVAMQDAQDAEETDEKKHETPEEQTFKPITVPARQAAH